MGTPPSRPASGTLVGAGREGGARPRARRSGRNNALLDRDRPPAPRLWAHHAERGGQECSLAPQSACALVAVARRWWLAWAVVAGLVTAVLVLIALFAYPPVVEPVFNSYEPLPAEEPRTEILRLADVEGLLVDEVLVAEASRRTTTHTSRVSVAPGASSSTTRSWSRCRRTRHLAWSPTSCAHSPRRRGRRHRARRARRSRSGSPRVGLLGLLIESRLNRRGARAGEAAVVPFVLAALALGPVLSSPI